MRILILNQKHFIFGGQEKVAISEAHYLHQVGHTVAVVAVNYPNTLQDDLKKYLLPMDDIDQQSIQNHNPSLMTKLKYSFSGLYNHSSARFIQEVIQDFKPDIVHSHGYNRYLTAEVFRVIHHHHIPIMTTEHDHKLGCPAYYLLQGNKNFCKQELCIKGHYYHCALHKCMDQSLLKSAFYALESYVNRNKYLTYTTKIIVPSKYLKNFLVRSGISKNKISVVKNFTDNISSSLPDEQYSGQYYLCHGRVTKEKGLMEIVHAFEQLPHLSLVIVGTGTLENDLKNYIQEHSLKNVFLEGYKTGHELLHYIKNAKAVILYSQHPENSPLAVLEAMAYGKPVIGSYIGGIPELCTHHENGVLVDPFNLNSLIQGIQMIENMSPEDYRQIYKKNIQKIAQNHTLEIHGNNLISIYEDVLKAIHKK